MPTTARAGKPRIPFRTPTRVAETHVLELALLPPRASVSRELELEVVPGLQPRDPDPE